MKKSIVHFTDFRCSDAENLQQKFTRLLKTADISCTNDIHPPNKLPLAKRISSLQD